MASSRPNAYDPAAIAAAEGYDVSSPTHTRTTADIVNAGLKAATAPKSGSAPMA